jgi:hypothetical protein
MAKKKLSFSFSKGMIEKNTNGKLIFTEINKDEETTYNLQSTLESLIGVEGVSISIGTEDIIPTVEDDD